MRKLWQRDNRVHRVYRVHRVHRVEKIRNPTDPTDPTNSIDSIDPINHARREMYAFRKNQWYRSVLRGAWRRPSISPGSWWWREPSQLVATSARALEDVQ